jgi:hypothetical protein
VIRLQRCFGPLAARAAGTYRLVGAYVGRILKGANTGIKKYPCRSVHWFCLAGIVDDVRMAPSELTAAPIAISAATISIMKMPSNVEHE